MHPGLFIFFFWKAVLRQLPVVAQAGFELRVPCLFLQLQRFSASRIKLCTTISSTSDFF